VLKRKVEEVNERKENETKKKENKKMDKISNNNEIKNSIAFLLYLYT
jgi:hypothetical protein